MKTTIVLLTLSLLWIKLMKLKNLCNVMDVRAFYKSTESVINIATTLHIGKLTDEPKEKKNIKSDKYDRSYK